MCLFTLLCITIQNLLPIATYAKQTEQQERQEVIRVGYPIQKGLTEIDENGRYSGYSYEYLQEIANYTGWKYEFVQVEGTQNESILTLLQMLKDGEIDLIGALSGLPSGDFSTETLDYCFYSYGNSYAVLYVLNSNTAINESNYQSMKDMRIAVTDKAKFRNEKLEQFCSLTLWQPKLVYCESYEDQYEALKDGRADAMLGIDLSIPENVRIIAKFSPSPYYFATTKGNKQLVNEINATLLKIDASDPYFSIGLYEKYFSTKQVFVLNDEETDYISKSKNLRVGFVPNGVPLQYVESETGIYKGISIDILSYITTKTGLQFELIPCDSQEEIYEKLGKHELDLAIGIPYELDMGSLYNISLTQPYLLAQVMLIYNTNIDPKNLEGRKLALPRGTNPPYHSSKTIVWYNTIQECIRAVNDGEADYSYGNADIIQYYTKEKNYKNIVSIHQPELVSEICISGGRPINPMLLSVLNKAIRSISESEMQFITTKNALEPYTKVTFHSYLEANPGQVIFIIGVTSFVIVFVLLFFLYTYIKQGRDFALKNARYERLSEISNEYLFEYDYVHDCLTLTDKSVDAFGGEKVYPNYLANRVMEKEGREGEQNFYDYLLREETICKELYLTLPHGEVRWVNAVMESILDEHKRPVYAIGKFTDIQKEKEEKDKLIIQAQKDSLTGIYNAATCRALISDMLAQQDEDCLGALFIMDIDYFKTINDQFGHYTGDKVLANMASILVETFRKADIIGRLGGDEFVVFMRNVPKESAVIKKCETLKQKLQQFADEEGIGTLTLSIGITISNANQTFDILYRKADTALYVVKNRGRNGYEIA